MFCKLACVLMAVAAISGNPAPGPNPPVLVAAPVHHTVLVSRPAAISSQSIVQHHPSSVIVKTVPVVHQTVPLVHHQPIVYHQPAVVHHSPVLVKTAPAIALHPSPLVVKTVPVVHHGPTIVHHSSPVLLHK